MSEQDATTHLVNTAIEMLVEDPGLLLERGLRGDDVCERAQVSQTTFYRKFNKSSFIDTVMDALVVRDDSPRDVSHEISAALVASNGDLLSAVRQLSLHGFRAARDDPATRRRLLALTLGRTRRRTARSLRQMYEARDNVAIEMYRTLFETWGATLRAPFTATLLGVTVTAVSDGLTQRWRADPDAVPDGLMAEVILALITTIVDPQQRHEHIDDAAGGLAADIAAQFRLKHSKEIVGDPRRSVIKAAEGEFRRRGYFLTSLELIAARSGIPSPTVKKLFPTKAHIIVGALSRDFAMLRDAIQDDVTLGNTEVDTIERHLARCAQLIADKPEFTDALIAAVAHDTYAEAESTLEIKKELNFPSLIAPIIERGQQSGVFTDALAAGEVAATIMNTLFLRCFTRRSVDPEENAAFVRHLLVSGIRP